MQVTQKNFYKKLLGRSGEVRAQKFLKKNGYKILEKNYKTFIGEIDIIASLNDEIVFVEVKTRKDESFGKPSEAVDRKKQEKYFKVATEYLIKKYNSVEVRCRFDVIEVEEEKINHIKNAFFM